MNRYAEVIVDIAAVDVDRVFTYAIPDNMEIRTGARVHVPFGPRQVEGYVIALKNELGELDERKLRLIISTDDESAILPSLINLAIWMKETYHCLLVDALRLMLPSPLRGNRVSVKHITLIEPLVFGSELENVCASLKKAPKRREVLSLIGEICRRPGERITLPELQSRAKGCLPAVKALRDMGYVRLTDGESMRRPYKTYRDDIFNGPELMRDQKRAVAEIVLALDRCIPIEKSNGSLRTDKILADKASHFGKTNGVDDTSRFLVHGITGSGKTEVYMNAIGHALAQGRGAIFMVPEISLTSQMVEWFRKRFGSGAAVIHSGLSSGERYDEWRRVRRGEARVVIGARSAVFAPVERLGIIILDEEHENAYLSDRHPRYDAREVAAHRCRTEDAVLVLGSATPSLKTFARTIQGKYVLLELMNRVNGRELPETTIVDMRDELARGNKSVLSAVLRQELAACLEKGKQSVLFINRRGHSPFVSCRACGYVVKCEQCDVSMTYHQDGCIMRCHYCAAYSRPPAVCPKCGSKYIKFFGAGTQKVEEAVKEHFPEASIFRMDADTTKQKDSHDKLIRAFKEGKAQILIGTQMVAKGLDFPNVTLVGVIAADSTLNLPDYNSYERTFQLITQVSGRAGRADSPGKVVVQTYDPNHYAVALAAMQDYRAFYVREMERRRRGLYPPFTVLARLLISGKKENIVREVCESLEREMTEFFTNNANLSKQVIQMRGMEAPIAFIRGEYRWQLFLKLYAKGPTNDILVKLDAISRIPADAAVFLEVNPPAML